MDLDCTDSLEYLSSTLSRINRKNLLEGDETIDTEAKVIVTIVITLVAALLIAYVVDTIVGGNETIEIKSPATLYHSSEIRIAEIRGQWPRAEKSVIHRWLDSANVHVIDMDFERSSCWITYVNNNQEE